MKFGKIIDMHKAVLIFYYDETPQFKMDVMENFHSFINDLCASIGPDARVVKLSMFRNKDLCTSLGIHFNPTVELYVDGQQIYRQQGIQPIDHYINIIKLYTEHDLSNSNQPH